MLMFQAGESQLAMLTQREYNGRMRQWLGLEDATMSPANRHTPLQLEAMNEGLRSS